MADLASDADRLAELALAEDGPRDVTTELAADPAAPARGVIEYRSGGVLAGVPYAEAVATRSGCRVEWAAPEGGVLPPMSSAGVLHGSFGGVLRAERPLLNMLQRGSGIANATRAFVGAVAGTPCRVLHTRKTAPGLRRFDVAAVLAGGGGRHRLDLAHEVMIKDNHWQALQRRGVTLATVLEQARARGITACQVEVESEEQLDTACAAGATRLLIDNQTPETVRRWAAAARRRRPGIEIEATGGITLGNARAYAEAGADFISIGALTHSAQAADLGLEIMAGNAVPRLSRRKTPAPPRE